MINVNFGNTIGIIAVTAITVLCIMDNIHPLAALVGGIIGIVIIAML